MRLIRRFRCRILAPDPLRKCRVSWSAVSTPLLLDQQLTSHTGATRGDGEPSGTFRSISIRLSRDTLQRPHAFDFRPDVATQYANCKKCETRQGIAELAASSAVECEIIRDQAIGFSKRELIRGTRSSSEEAGSRDQACDEYQYPAKAKHRARDGTPFWISSTAGVPVFRERDQRPAHPIVIGNDIALAIRLGIRLPI